MSGRLNAVEDVGNDRSSTAREDAGNDGWNAAREDVGNDGWNAAKEDARNDGWNAAREDARDDVWNAAREDAGNDRSSAADRLTAADRMNAADRSDAGDRSNAAGNDRSKAARQDAGNDRANATRETASMLFNSCADSSEISWMIMCAAQVCCLLSCCQAAVGERPTHKTCQHRAQPERSDGISQHCGKRVCKNLCFMQCMCALSLLCSDRSSLELAGTAKMHSTLEGGMPHTPLRKAGFDVKLKVLSSGMAPSCSFCPALT